MKSMLIACFLLLSLLSEKEVNAQDKFRIDILQNGIVLQPENGVVVLDNAPFAIRVSLFQQEGVYMSASLSKRFYTLNDDEEVPDIEYLAYKTRAESTSNADKELFLDDEYVSYYFHSPEEDWTRFDSLIVNEASVIGFKTVELFMDDQSEIEIPVSEMTKDVFLFFLATTPYKRSVKPKEIQRYKLHLKWKKA